MPLLDDYPDPADSDGDADIRFKKAKGIDPFPQISPSLLNSADIHDYVRMTGMLYPYYERNLKSASYEAAIYGQCIWWDEKGERHDLFLQEGKGKEFILKANSIALVQVEPFFRLPDYIALRFNLKIAHVHRGILLGTGPLVDPGFVGRLLIPLHNLTTNPYTFKRGDGLIWIEFTKTSPISGRPNIDVQLSHRGVYHEFPQDKINRNPDWYIARASEHKPIRSSIPDVGRESREAARKAEADAKLSARLVRNFSLYGGIILVLTLATLTYQTWNLIHNAWKSVTEAQQLIQAREQKGSAHKIEELQGEVQKIDKRVMDEITKLQQQLEKVKAGLSPRPAKSTQSDKQ